MEPGTEPGPETVEEEPEEALSLDEAYIETVRCTSCNECTNLNGQIFEYNEEKQAFIKDGDKTIIKKGPHIKMHHMLENLDHLDDLEVDVKHVFYII